MWTKIKRLLSDTDKPEQQTDVPEATSVKIRMYRMPGPSRARAMPPKLTDGLRRPSNPRQR